MTVFDGDRKRVAHQPGANEGAIVTVEWTAATGAACVRIEASYADGGQYKVDVER